MWDPVQGDELLRLLGHTSYIFSLSFSPNDATLGSGDSTIRLWKTERVDRELEAQREELAARAETKRLLKRLFREECTVDKVAEALCAETAHNAAPAARRPQCPIPAPGTRAAVIRRPPAWDGADGVFALIRLRASI